MVSSCQLNITDYKLRIKSIVSYSTWIEIESHINKVIKNEKLKIKTRHDKKYRSLKIPVNQDEFNNKLVYNLSYRTLSEAEESLLAKGWKYAIKINRCNVLNMKAEFEYMYYIMEKNLLLGNKDNSNKIKTLINEFGNHFKKKLDKEVQNLSFDELNAISTLLNEHSLVISKVDKGNAIVVLNKSDYLNKLD